MTKNILYTLLCCYLLILSSCKNETTPEIQPGEIVAEQIPQAPEVVPDHIASSVLTGSKWEIEIILDSGAIKDDNAWKGNVLEFTTDGAYVWENGKKLNKGTFILDSENNIVTLNASDPTLSSEWNIKYKRSVMVWIGTAKFGNNSMQMKLNQVRPKVEGQ